MVPLFSLGSNPQASVRVSLLVVSVGRVEMTGQCMPLDFVALKVLKYEPVKRCTNTREALWRHLRLPLLSIAFGGFPPSCGLSFGAEVR